MPRPVPGAVRYPENHARYGLTRADVVRSVEAQGGRCLICGNVPLVWVVDHDHDLAALHGHGSRTVACKRCVRGLICKPCNTGLGMFRDDPAALERAAAYIRMSRGQL